VPTGVRLAIPDIDLCSGRKGIIFYPFLTNILSMDHSLKMLTLVSRENISEPDLDILSYALIR
jgi:hypothetical protein